MEKYDPEKHGSFAEWCGNAGQRKITDELLARVETTADGSVTALVGKDAVNIAALATLLTALRLEIETNGRMQLTRGPSALRRAKGVTGLRTHDRRKHVARIEVMLEEAKRKVVYVTREET